MRAAARPRLLAAVAAVAAATLVLGCATPSPVAVQAPDGFASYDLGDGRTDTDLAPHPPPGDESGGGAVPRTHHTE